MAFLVVALKGRLNILPTSGGLAHRETGRFPGGPLLHEVFRPPSRPYTRIYFIDNQLTQSVDCLNIQRTGHDGRVSPSERMTVMHLIHSPAGYRLPWNQNYF